MTTAWEFGYWDKGWNHPDARHHQHWEGACNFEPWSIEKALNRAIETGFLDPSLREEVRQTCLNEGEYFFGSDQTSGWLIGQNEDYTCPFPYPYEPIWMMVEIPSIQWRYDWSATLCPVLSNYEVEELNQENRIIHSNLTLLQILNLILPSGEDDPQFQDICLQCLYACSPEESYIYYSSSDQWIQICRKFTDKEEADFISNTQRAQNLDFEETSVNIFTQNLHIEDN